MCISPGRGLEFGRHCYQWACPIFFLVHLPCPPSASSSFLNGLSCSREKAWSIFMCTWLLAVCSSSVALVKAAECIMPVEHRLELLFLKPKFIWLIKLFYILRCGRCINTVEAFHFPYTKLTFVSASICFCLLNASLLILWPNFEAWFIQAKYQMEEEFSSWQKIAKCS